jgi:Ni/Co efflux regulator RcnB
MKKTLLVLPLVAALAACSTTDIYQKRADEERERQEKLVERALDRAPKWMRELPKSQSAVYQTGTAVSPDMDMSLTKAKTMAFGKICMAAGGQVNQQSKIYRTDSENASTEFSELAIKSFCPGVDITGVEVVESRQVAEGARFRTYVVVALPTGEANQLQVRKDRLQQQRAAETRSREAYREMDRNSRSQ